MVAGRRRFTLFPPAQLPNMYVGPLEFTLAGQPISMVRLESPDFEEYPRFREALEHAQARRARARATPCSFRTCGGITSQSLEPFNVLVNYWWDDMPPWQGSPFEALLHGILAVRNLPPERREIWRQAFEHFVFRAATRRSPISPRRNAASRAGPRRGSRS